MNLEEQIKEVIEKISEKARKEEKIRDENFYNTDYNSIAQFYKSIGKIESYCEITILLTEALNNGK